MNSLDDQSTTFARSLSQNTRSFLSNERGLSDQVIETFQLGENGDRISIPVRDQSRRIVDIRLYLPPHNRKGKKPKVIGLEGVDGSPKIFPQEIFTLLRLREKEDCGEMGENLETLGYLGSIYQSIVNWNTLFIVEGELDALALLSNGYLAITNTCGAKNWKDEFSDLLARLSIPITVCMDADEAGEAGAQQRAESLFSRNVEVRVIEWPFERASGHDVTDELIQNGIDGLFQILKSAARFRDVISLDEIEAEEVEWIFRPYIAIGKVSLIEGHPGIGKTFLMLKIAASVSIGGKDLLQQENFIPENVLLMTAEDGIADTIKPRIEKMDADLTKVLVPKELFTLDKVGFEILKKLIERYRPKLVIIDPMMPFLDSRKDTHKASDMRPFFKQLGTLAQKFRCAVVVTRHLAKSLDLKGISAGLGSIDISAAVRSILQVSEDQDVPGLKRVTHIKCNVGQKGKAFGYRLDEGCFSWVGELNDIDSNAEEDSGELERACSFLLDALSNGPVSALEITVQAKDAGLSKSTLNRAKKKIKIRSKRATDSGKTTSWNWSLPDYENSKDFSSLDGQSTLFEDGESLTEERQ